MTQRVTEKQLQDMAAHLSKVTGLDITKGGAYGGTCFQIGYGSENLTGYVTKQQCMDWAYAFLKGHALGQIKHKHDMMKTQGVPQFTEFVCGDCGVPLTDRYESGWEIGIAPFRWLCYTCFHNHVDGAPTPAKDQEPAPATPAETVTAPNGREFPKCREQDCNAQATHAIRFPNGGSPYYIAVNDLQDGQWCVFHIDHAMTKLRRVAS